MEDPPDGKNLNFSDEPSVKAQPMCCMWIPLRGSHGKSPRAQPLPTEVEESTRSSTSDTVERRPQGSSDILTDYLKSKEHRRGLKYILSHPESLDMLGHSKDVLQPYKDFEVFYPSGEWQLRGFLVHAEDPKGTILFNHGSIGLLPSNWPGIMELLDAGYTVFAPIRRGHNGNPGPYWEDLLQGDLGTDDDGEQLVAGLRAEAQDLKAALSWIREQPGVDPGRIGVMGSSFGAAVSLLFVGDESPERPKEEETQHQSLWEAVMADKTKLEFEGTTSSIKEEEVGETHDQEPHKDKAGPSVSVRCVVSFSGPSMTWHDAPALQEALKKAVARIAVPVFLIQASNDHSLVPTYALGMEMAKSRTGHETRIYQPVGTRPMHGHGMFGRAPELWIKDVVRFLDMYMGPS